ncbi:PTS system transporter subunit IIA [Klebsiella pneumoniae]|uniref:PTS system transporter subunit IIA n=15 Tax=Enterobacterales TaxID=91347 RepID=A0A377TT14_KLEPN|nr:PTS system transporter subunit IIA [Klebsiella pneumoniae]
MDISTVLNVKNIKLNMTARTKEEVIEELTDLLIQDGAVTNKEDFIRDVWLREELGSTGFENHIAIPHGKSSGVSRTALAIGRTQHAIPWETMDGSDVRCVILFAVCLVIKMPPIFACWHKCLGHWRMKTLSLNYLLNLIHIKSLRFSIQKLKTPMLNTNLLISISNLLN